MKNRGLTNKVWHTIAPRGGETVEAPDLANELGEDVEAVSSSLNYLRSLGRIEVYEWRTGKAGYNVYRVIPGETHNYVTSTPSESQMDKHVHRTVDEVIRKHQMGVKKDDIDTILEIMFPNGIGTDMIRDVIAFVKTVEDLIDRAT